MALSAVIGCAAEEDYGYRLYHSLNISLSIIFLEQHFLYLNMKKKVIVDFLTSSLLH